MSTSSPSDTLPTPTGFNFFLRKVSALCDRLRLHGSSLEEAAWREQVPPETLAEWQRDLPEFNRQIEAARAAFRQDLGLEPAEDRRAGRPTLYTEPRVELICTSIRQNGQSASAAAQTAGLSPNTVSQWKKKHPEFEARLAQARALYQMDCLQEIRYATTASGRPDWRSRAWLMERMFPEQFGKRRPTPAPDPDPEAFNELKETATEEQSGGPKPAGQTQAEPAPSESERPATAVAGLNELKESATETLSHGDQSRHRPAKAESSLGSALRGFLRGD